MIGKEKHHTKEDDKLEKESDFFIARERSKDKKIPRIINAKNDHFFMKNVKTDENE